MFSLLTYLFILYILGGICASILYHRILTHKSLTLKPWFEKVLVILALPAGTPIQWVGTHRQHHNFTDKIGDPHSPHLFGFWYAHCGWYINSKNEFICIIYALGGPLRMLFDSYWRPRNRLEFNHLAKELSENQFYKKISEPRNYTLIMIFYVAVLISFTYLIWCKIGVLFLWITLIIIYNFGDAVNSVGHLFGEDLKQKNKAKNNVILSIFTFGEGIHANHHLTPSTIFLNSNNPFSLSKFIIKTWIFLRLTKN
jgi:fatty-acid desaturase